MKYSFAAAALAMASGAIAKPVITNASDISPEEGKPFTVELKGCDDGCTIYLMQGPKDKAQPVLTLDSDATDSAKVTIPKGKAGSGTYGIRVQDNSVPADEADSNSNNDYSPTFEYTGTGPTSLPPVGATPTSTGSSASSTGSSDMTTATTTDDNSSSAKMSSTMSTTMSTTGSSSSTKTTGSSSSKTSSTAGPSVTPPDNAAGAVAFSPIALVGAAVAALFL